MHIPLSVLLTLFALCTYATAVRAADTNDPINLPVALKRCAMIAAPAQRLKCFDRLSGRSSTTDATESSKSIPNHWRTVRKANPIDDTPQVTIYTTAIEGQTGFGRKPHLIFRCQNNKTEALVLWHAYIGSGRYSSAQRVLIRLGSGIAQNQNWSNSTSGTATFAPQPIPLAREWVKHTRVVAQTTPYSRGPVTAIFDLTGLAEALKPLAQACNWSLIPR